MITLGYTFAVIGCMLGLSGIAMCVYLLITPSRRP